MNKQNNIDDLFRQAREQQPEASFMETKELFLNSLARQNANLNEVKKGKLFTFKNKIIMSTLIGFVALISLVFFLNDLPTKEVIKRKNLANEKNEIGEKSLDFRKEKNTNEALKTQSKQLQAISQNEFQNESFEEHINIKPENSTIKEDKQTKYLAFKTDLNEDYIFPKLTGEEIKKTLKQKKKMLKALAKMDKRAYSFIPAGSFKYQGEMISVASFVIQKTEVSNLEYRTFLFDLLIQNRKEEFLKAKPEQHKWVEILGESFYPMENLYFSHEGYNDYPVVNISREGAELYCKWLTNELKKYDDKNKEMRFINVRIPTRQEWVKAASGEGLHKDYAFNGELYNAKLNFYGANFNLNNFQGTIKKGFENQIKDSLFPSSKTYGYKHPIGPWKNTVLLNHYGLYNMSGNVAEMVLDGANHIPKFTDTIPKQKPILTPGTAGGGWMNSAEEIKIYAPDNHSNAIEAHPNIGFRLVFNYLNRAPFY
jgi:formylglycine-generating enzyme required for sulfatase activity